MSQNAAGILPLYTNSFSIGLTVHDVNRLNSKLQLLSAAATPNKTAEEAERAMAAMQSHIKMIMCDNVCQCFTPVSHIDFKYVLTRVCCPSL